LIILTFTRKFVNKKRSAEYALLLWLLLLKLATTISFVVATTTAARHNSHLSTFAHFFRKFIFCSVIPLPYQSFCFAGNPYYAA